MDHRQTTDYRPLRRRGRWWSRWHLLARHVRLRPPWPWWAMWLGGATAVTALLHVTGPVPWWIGPPVGLVLGIAVLALTALDDVRRPVASLRVLAAELREGHPVPTTFAVRAEVFDVPLYAPPPGTAGDTRLSGGGASYGPRLLSPARPRFDVSWSGATSDRSKDAGTTTVVAPDDTRAADAADLQPWGGGWAATLRLDDRHRLDLWGHGELPDRIELVRWDLADLGQSKV